MAASGVRVRPSTAPAPRWSLGRRPRSHEPLMARTEQPWANHLASWRRLCLRVLGFVRPSIGQPLALGALDRLLGALAVFDAECLAHVVAELEFGQIAVQVLLAAVLIDALHPALENREVSLDGVRVLLGIVETDILAGRMVHRAVTGVLGANLRVEPALVRHELALLVGADALLARRHQVEAKHPLVQRDVRALEDRPDRDAELALAAVAVVEAGP